MSKILIAKNNIVADMEYHTGNADIFVYGGPKNWKDDFRNNHELIEILLQKNIYTVYIPDTTTFNGLLCSPDDFIHEYTVKGIKVMTGAIADGFVVPKGSAVIMYSADCPTIVYHDLINQRLVVAHAGLASLINKYKIIIDVPFRSHESIIEEMMRGVKYNDSCEIFVLCGIGAKSYIYDFNHSKYGERNLKILQFLFEFYGTDVTPYFIGIKGRSKGRGNISLLNIILQQLGSCGVDTLKVIYDSVDTYSDPRFHSYYWYSQFGKEEDKFYRNCTMVINNIEE